MKKIDDNPIVKLYIVGILCTLPFGIVLLFGVPFADKGQIALLLIGLLLVGLAILLIYKSYIELKYNVCDEDIYKKTYYIRKSKALIENKKKFIDLFEGNELQVPLRELMERLQATHYEFLGQLMSTPLNMYKPVSPMTASVMGSMIAGFAGGIVAAESARQKQEAYEQNVKDVIESKVKTAGVQGKFIFFINSIESILYQNKKACGIWEKERNKIVEELKETHRVKGGNPDLSVLDTKKEKSVVESKVTNTSSNSKTQNATFNETKDFRTETAEERKRRFEADWEEVTRRK